jgi:excisionase family DNA binding protein
MFYSMKEVVDKLGMGEDEVRKLVKAGRLREFRDGSTLLFKLDEVEALMSDTGVMAAKAAAAAKPAEPEKPAEEEEISLAPEQPEAPVAPIEVSDADTQIVEEGINVLGETDAKDSIEETKDMGALKELGPEETSAAADEASLKEIEGDVNLDTFGSGSGLLDLSLQADDTSLGGILDEIYTPEGEGKAKPTEEVGEGEAAEAATEAEPESILAEEALAEPQIAPGMPATTAVYAEAAPDSMSNALGLMLWIPLLATICTAIVTLLGLNNKIPATLRQMQGFVWYAMIGLAVVSGLIVGGAMTMSGEKKPKQPKPPKVKKEKPKKENKGKEAKPAGPKGK